MMRVLLVEDDVPVAAAMDLMLKVGCRAVTDVVNTGTEALELARHYEYDAVVLDLMLPDMEGYEVLKRMRAAGQVAPVLVLTGLTRPQGALQAFAAGADDVMIKPFDKDELTARLKAIVRRSKGYSQPGLQIGPMSLDLESRVVRVDGEKVPLTGKEYAVLELLVLRIGTVLTKDQFLNHLYGGMDEPEMKIIDVFICKLRRKLAQAGADNIIGTIWGRGYIIRSQGAKPTDGQRLPWTGRETTKAPQAEVSSRSIEEILQLGTTPDNDVKAILPSEAFNREHA